MAFWEALISSSSPQEGSGAVRLPEIDNQPVET
jgi:hypothetical protein